MNKKHAIILIVITLLLVAGIALAIFMLRNSEPVVDTGETNTTETSVEQAIPFVSALDNPAFADDIDRDGISNEDEVQYGTSPEDADTDGDGLDDLDEINTYGTDPTNPDTDGDGFWDGVELINGYNPNGEGTLN